MDAGSSDPGGNDAGAAMPQPGKARSCQQGGKSFADGETDIPSDDGCNRCTCRDGRLSCTMIACQSPCVVARRMDQCCAPYEAVRRTALADDECLYPFPATFTDADRAQRCSVKRGSCAAVTCPIDSGPPSRVAVPDGANGCSFADECQTAEDCVSAFAEGRCCECRSAVPRALLEANQCVAETLAELSPTCDACPRAVLCNQCAPSVTPFCTIGDAWSRCQ